MSKAQNKINKLIRQIYFPPVSQNENWSFKDFIDHDSIRYYSYARHAICDALKLCKLKQGDKVLIPGFICREVLASLHAVGAVPVYYDITSELKIKSLEGLPVAKVLIVINYFGLPSDLDKIDEYCLTNDVVVIEDNSHGFLSKDKDNRTLGTRTHIGIFSLRKSMPIVNGAALVVNEPELQTQLKEQLNYISDRSVFKYEYFKRVMKNIIPEKKYYLIIFFIKIKQTLRLLLKGSPLTVSSSESEISLPDEPYPHSDLKEYIKTIIESDEVKRRRSLYKYLEEYLGEDVDVIVKKLEINIVPYVFAFHCNDIEKIKIKLSKLSLNCYKWPELPDKIKSSCPEYYKNVWMVPFLW